MRTNNSLKNSIAALCSNMITIIIGFIAQAIFVNQLGAEYLGLNGLFNNIVSMLAIAELGIGSAIIYNLYKPIAENDIDSINTLMNFYKKCYRVISLIVFFIGVAIVPFLPSIVGTISIEVNIFIVYALFILDVLCSYLLSYRRSILYADQKNYIISIVHIFYLIIMNLVQIIILIVFKNYYLYLIIKIIMRFLENFIIVIITKRRYLYLNEKISNKLSKEVKNDIITKTKGLLFHKIGTFLVLGSDNIIISKFIGIIQVGLYSNYQLVISAVTNFLSQIFSSVTSSVGNLLVSSDYEKNYNVFRRMRFLNFWLSTFASTAILIIINSFIICWIGNEYLLGKLVVIVLVINFYFKTSRCCINSFKEAAGIFHEDRFVPLLEAGINIVSSIILLHYFGLAGVFMGTVLSNLVLFLYSYPKYVYKKLFRRSYLQYYKEFLSYLFIGVVVACLTYVISSFIVINNIYFRLIANIILGILSPNILLYLIFRKSDEFSYFSKLAQKIISHQK